MDQGLDRKREVLYLTSDEHMAREHLLHSVGGGIPLGAQPYRAAFLVCVEKQLTQSEALGLPYTSNFVAHLNFGVE